MLAGRDAPWRAAAPPSCSACALDGCLVRRHLECLFETPLLVSFEEFMASLREFLSE